MPWFRPRCKIDADSKAWIDARFTWLAEKFGLESLWDAQVILPNDEYFPDAFDGSVDSAETMFERVCEYMLVDSARVELRFYTEARMKPVIGSVMTHDGSAGLYEQGWRQKVSVEMSMLEDPLALAATMAHELGHVHLLGDGHISPDVEDHEPLTDLLTVFFGLGVFTANSVIRESNWQGAGMEGWSVGRLGYLTAEMYAYALALFAWARAEHAPSWSKHLRLDVRSPFKKNLRYLIATKDSDFAPMMR